MPTTDWSVLFDGLLAAFDALEAGERLPERLAEAIRDSIRPKCLALLVDARGSSARRLAWAHGFELPPERLVSRGQDPLSWLMVVTGVSLFGRRTQGYVTSFDVGSGRTASLCIVSNRRGQALVMERMFLAAAGVVFGRLYASKGITPTWGESALQPVPIGSRRRMDRPTRSPGALPTASEVDRRMLQKLALAVESVAESIVICDMSGTIEYVNPAFERMTGYSQGEAIGKNPRILKSGVHPPHVSREAWETVLSGRPWLGTLVNKRKNGRLYDEEITISPIRDKTNVLTGFISVGEDISDRLHHERERTALARASLAITGALDLSVALEIILNSAVQATTADGGGVIFVGRSKEEFTRPVHVGTVADDTSLSRDWFEAIEKFGSGQHDNVSIASESQLGGLRGPRSVAILPLRTKGEVLGVAFVVAHRPEAFSDRFTSVLESLASQATVVVENALLHRDIRRRIGLFESLRQLTGALRVAPNLDDLLRLLVEEGSRFLRATGSAVLLLDPTGSFLSVRASWGQCAAMEGSFPAKEWILGLPLTLGHLVIANKEDMEAFARLTGIERLHALTLTPLGTSMGQIGVLVLSRQQPVAFSRADIDLVAVLGDVASTAIHRVRLRDELEEAYVGTTLALAEAVDARDSYVAGHAQRTGNLAERVARVLELPEDQVQDIRYGAILRDVGKISVPDSVLKKMGPLSPEEWDVIRRHTIAGARILAPVTRSSRAVQIVRYHHERWDGSGYPEGLRAEEIPLGARIVAVVYAYTAMIEERTYRKALSHNDTLQELQRHAGTQFDPAVVDAFLRVVSSSPSAD